LLRTLTPTPRSTDDDRHRVFRILQPDVFCVHTKDGWIRMRERYRLFFVITALALSKGQSEYSHIKVFIGRKQHTRRLGPVAHHSCQPVRSETHCWESARPFIGYIPPAVGWHPSPTRRPARHPSPAAWNQRLRAAASASSALSFSVWDKHRGIYDIIWMGLYFPNNKTHTPSRVRLGRSLPNGHGAFGAKAVSRINNGPLGMWIWYVSYFYIHICIFLTTGSLCRVSSFLF
jgi:hypothetical protein